MEIRKTPWVMLPYNEAECLASDKLYRLIGTLLPVLALLSVGSHYQRCSSSSSQLTPCSLQAAQTNQVAEVAARKKKLAQWRLSNEYSTIA